MRTELMLVMTACLTLGAGAQPLLVWSESTEVFDQQEKARTLYEGEVVEATEEAKSGWLSVRYNDDTYRARREQLQSLDEIRAAVAELAAKQEQRLRDIARRRRAAAADLLEAQLGELELAAQAVVTHEFGGRRIYADTATTTSARRLPLARERLLSNRDERRREHELEERIETARATLTQAARDEQQLQQAVLPQQARLARASRRLAQFAAAPTRYRLTWYRVGSQGSWLYQLPSKKRAAWLQPYQLVPAVPARGSSDRLNVLFDGGQLVTSVRALDSVDQLLLELAEKAAALRLRSAQVRQRLELQRALSARRSELAAELAVHLSLRGQFAVAPRLPDCPLCGCREPACVHGVIATIDESDVKKLLKAWQEAADESSSQQSQQWAQLEQLARELTVAETELTALQTATEALAAVTNP